MMALIILWLLIFLAAAYLCFIGGVAIFLWSEDRNKQKTICGRRSCDGCDVFAIYGEQRTGICRQIAERRKQHGTD